MKILFQNNKNNKISFTLICISLFILPLSNLSLAAGVQQSFTFDGQLLTNSGSPNTSSSVTFTFQILNPNKNCGLYEETVSSIDLSSPDRPGYFSVHVGTLSGNASRTGNDPGHSMSDIFSNKSSNLSGFDLTGSSSCPSGYLPNIGDARYLRVKIYDGAITETLNPDFLISSVPTALVAESIQGITPSSIIQVAGTVSQNSINNLTSRETPLMSLADGTSGLYSKVDGSNFTPTAALNMNSQVIQNLASPVASTDAVNKNYSDSQIGGRAIDITNLASINDGQSLMWSVAANKWITFTPATPVWSSNSGAIYSIAENIGIGTSSPTTKLEVIGDIKNSGNLIVTNKIGVGGVPDALAQMKVFSNTGTSPNLKLESSIGSASLNFYVVGAPTDGATIKSNSLADIVIETPGGIHTTFKNIGDIQLHRRNLDLMSTNKIVNMAQPVNPQDATTKNYVDSKSKFIGAKSYLATNSIPIAIGTEVPIPFDSVSFDTDSSVLLGSLWTYTAPKSGYYRVSARIEFVNIINATSKLLVAYGSGLAEKDVLDIRLAESSSSNPIDYVPSLSGSSVIFLNTGQQIQFQVFHSSGTSESLAGVTTNKKNSYCTVEYIGD